MDRKLSEKRFTRGDLKITFCYICMYVFILIYNIATTKDS